MDGTVAFFRFERTGVREEEDGEEEEKVEEMETGEEGAGTGAGPEKKKEIKNKKKKKKKRGKRKKSKRETPNVYRERDICKGPGAQKRTRTRGSTRGERGTSASEPVG